MRKRKGSDQLRTDRCYVTQACWLTSKLSSEMEASCALLRECFFARLVVTKGILFGAFCRHYANAPSHYGGNAKRPA